MQINQFKYRQGTGVATIFTAETEAEQDILETLQSLIEGEKGALSRKCFTFDEETNSMSIDMEKYNENSRRFKNKVTAAMNSEAAPAGRPRKNKAETK